MQYEIRQKNFLVRVYNNCYSKNQGVVLGIRKFANSNAFEMLFPSVYAVSCFPSRNTMEDANGKAAVAANGNAPGKTSVLSTWSQYFTLRGFLRRLGWTIGRFPHVYLLVNDIYRLSDQSINTPTSTQRFAY
jgi:hypothetical protein